MKKEKTPVTGVFSFTYCTFVGLELVYFKPHSEYISSINGVLYRIY